MRYAIASLVALLLSGVLFVFHWWVWSALEKEGINPPLENVELKLPKSLEAMVSLDDFLYAYRFILIPVLLGACLGVAWLTRKRL